MSTLSLAFNGCWALDDSEDNVSQQLSGKWSVENSVYEVFIRKMYAADVGMLRSPIA